MGFFQNHYFNDLVSYLVGNLLQGFSSAGWKEQHNMHHAATNVIGRDGDIDLMPLWAVVPSDLHASISVLSMGASSFIQ
ncbi:unnamed protein product [Gongylonema pulchrum]|uniref:FA_desaturase domain-containing protein n=1 Tax=Gongylonema pulchrum TaxID=637853 RepID=A0A183EXF9_9BILA|nr:unnamed protein product [Gongylonema pulchrum]